MDIDDLAPGYERQPTGAPWMLVLFAVLFAAFFFRALPLELDPQRTTNAPDQFDTTRALERLATVLDGTPHPSDSAALDSTRERLLSTISAMGYMPEIHDETACRGSISGSSIRCARVQNVLFRTGPSTGPALVLAAHYDSVEASPGFGDDGVGLAVWLEVAQILKDTQPAKPVVFLLTDGEETALLGAQAFLNAKTYGIEVGRIINLEARGVRGPAMMFETGHPNAGIVTDWSKNGARPIANSMMTAVYELLPNSTDLTPYLQSGLTGINIAIADGLDFYHTQHDDLAHLNRPSVQHMGDQALGATRAYIASDWAGDKVAGAEIAYSDIATRAFVSLPQTIALMLLGLCFGLSALLFMRPAKSANWKKPDWRALALPPALYVAAGLIAYFSQQLIGFLRPEPAFWIAYPQAMNAVVFLGTLLGASALLAFLAKTSSREVIFASGWMWFLVIGVGLSIAVPGFSMIFLIPAAVFVVAAIVAWLAPPVALIAHGVAGAFLILIFFPLIQLTDVMMGLGLPAMFGVLEAMAIAPLLSLAGPLPTQRMFVMGAVGAAFCAAIATALLVPAFTPERPLALNFTAHYDMDAREAALFASASPGALPAAVKSQLAISDENRLPGVTARLASRRLDFVDRPFATAAIVSTERVAQGGDKLTLQLSAPDARMIRLRIPAGARPTQLDYAGNSVAMVEAQNGYFIVDCVGRACNGANISFILNPGAASPDNKPEWIVQGYWLGLPPDAGATADARDENSVRIQMGDVTVTTTRTEF